MKKIGIDARLYSQTGVGTYLQNFLFNLDKKVIGNEKYFVYLLKTDFQKVNFKNNRIVKKIADQKWHSFSEQMSFLIQLIKDNLDLMHFTYFSYPILYWKKFIVTVHDTTPLRFKTGKASTRNKLVYWFKYLIFNIVFWLQVHRAIKIITPTKTVKKELIKIYGKIISKKIISIYEGVSYKVINGNRNLKIVSRYQNKFKTDFFIYVGNFYPHKNVERLIDAFSQVKKNFKLILIGPDDYFTKRILRCIDTSKSKKRIILIKSPSMSDLIFFYKYAKAIIHSSLSEGFGLPLIEAAYFNTPIIASDIPVFKELWGSNYISFDPYSSVDIAEKINQFIDKKPKFNYEKLLKKYSFSKMTNEILKIYQNVNILKESASLE